jgi:branched-chain amino acid aminotransferase
LFNGWGLFTTLRIYQGQPFAYERHWERLRRDAERTRMPFDFDPAGVRAHVEELVEANRVTHGCARLIFVYNQVGFWRSRETMPPVDVIIFTSDLPDRGSAARLCLLPHGRYASHPLAGTKVLSWLDNVWALEGAHRRGFDEVILLNERGEVAECTAANIFCVRAGRVATPSLSSGCLAGVSRAILLEEIGPQLGLAIEERALLPAELYAADEIFISSTTREVQPVTQIEEHSFPSPGETTRRLQQAFGNYIAQAIPLRSAQGSSGARA